MAPHPLQSHVICDLTSLGENIFSRSDKVSCIEAGLVLSRYEFSLLGQSVTILDVFNL